MIGLLLAFSTVSSLVVAGPMADIDRIVNGDPVDIKAAPYVAYLDQSCGGSIITPRYLLSAAHCFAAGFKHYKVRLGSTFRDEGGVQYRIKNATIHPKYNISTVDYDFAVVELDEEIKFSESIQPIALASPDIKLPDGAMLDVYGWGTLKEGGEQSKELQKVSVPLYNHEKCKENYAKNQIELTDSMICAGYDEGGKDSCQSDSGGPLVKEGLNEGRVLYGVVSFGLGCGRPGLPGIYSPVSIAANWIKEILMDSM